ncbi:MAG: hypothetical protein IPN76_22375 [Saprospiraceae bacterium]|nr:hypothetical protein [Saprospiraceae bacterium]
MKAQQFKYAALTEGMTDCHPANYEEIQTLAFRFVREDLNHPDNFKPVKVSNQTAISAMTKPTAPL